jgi:nitroreductase
MQFHKIIVEFLGAAPEQMLVCGMSLGYADPDAAVNTLITEREPVKGFTRWLE